MERASNEAEFRAFEQDARESVRRLYTENHAQQTVALVREKHALYLPPRRERFGVWEALEALTELVDDSDPDLDLPQIDHALQTAESLRAAHKPRWEILVGLIHDLGKVLCRFGEPQWAVVGDTFPVGCAFDERIVFSELFEANPDHGRSAYASPNGMYEPGCGFDALLMSWGHDEYLYGVVRDHVPEEASYLIRFHSFYAAHAAGAYAHLMSPKDRERLPVLREFSRHDLYSKSEERPDRERLRPYYEELVREFLPPELDW